MISNQIPTSETPGSSQSSIVPQQGSDLASEGSSIPTSISPSASPGPEDPAEPESQSIRITLSETELGPGSNTSPSKDPSRQKSKGTIQEITRPATRKEKSSRRKSASEPPLDAKFRKDNSRKTDTSLPKQLKRKPQRPRPSVEPSVEPQQLTSVDSTTPSFSINHDPTKPREEHNLQDYYPDLNTTESLPFIVIPRNDTQKHKTKSKLKKLERNIISQIRRNQQRRRELNQTKQVKLFKKPVFIKVQENQEDDQDQDHDHDTTTIMNSKYLPYHRENLSPYSEQMLADNYGFSKSYTMDEQDHYFLQYHNRSRTNYTPKHIESESQLESEPQDQTVGTLTEATITPAEVNISSGLFEQCMTQLEHKWHTLQMCIPPPSPENTPLTSTHLSLYHSDTGHTTETITHPETLQPCSICFHSSTPDENNAMIWCDCCDVAVHMDCYGVRTMPGEGEVWLCSRCERLGLLKHPLRYPSKDQLRCAVCPSTTGAFKQLNDGQWCHLICGLWIPELGVANIGIMEPIDGLVNIPRERWELRCYLCKLNVKGACVQCSVKGCARAFHVTCGVRAGLVMSLDIEKAESGTEADVNGSALVHKAILNHGKDIRCYCHLHTPKGLAGEDVKDRIEKVKLFYNRDRKHKQLEIEPVDQESTTNKVKNHKWLTPRGSPLAPDSFISDLSAYLQTQPSLEGFTPVQISEVSLLMTKYWTLKRSYSPYPGRLSLIPNMNDSEDTRKGTITKYKYDGSNGEKLRKVMEFSELLCSDLEKLESLGEKLTDWFGNRIQDGLVQDQILGVLSHPGTDGATDQLWNQGLRALNEGNGRRLQLLQSEYYHNERHHLNDGFRNHYVPEKRAMVAMKTAGVQTEEDDDDEKEEEETQYSEVEAQITKAKHKTKPSKKSKPTKPQRRDQRTSHSKDAPKQCINCHITHSTLWRHSRNPEFQRHVTLFNGMTKVVGMTLCNACGVYEIRNHGKCKPVSEEDKLKNRGGRGLIVWEQERDESDSADVAVSKDPSGESLIGVDASERSVILLESRSIESTSSDHVEDQADGSKRSHPETSMNQRKTNDTGSEVEVSPDRLNIESSFDPTLLEPVTENPTDIADSVMFESGTAKDIQTETVIPTSSVTENGMLIDKFIQLNPNLKPQRPGPFAWRYLISMNLVTKEGYLIPERVSELVKVLKKRKSELEGTFDEESELVRGEKLKENGGSGKARQKKRLLDSLQFDVNFKIPVNSKSIESSMSENEVEVFKELQRPITSAFLDGHPHPELQQDVITISDSEQNLSPAPHPMVPSRKRSRPLRHAVVAAIENQRIIKDQEQQRLIDGKRGRRVGNKRRKSQNSSTLAGVSGSREILIVADNSAITTSASGVIETD
ncbi:hypothetical protein WICPIJ_004776 [Wickerhamomyces pijperi]|uniref:PHD-type domain-containing protein n=1 Tax=Wickerhamomyces pijperi TaxID=599730 RepID=A0A9P8TMF8_WICPI|nr:hypothetical protein WICPIJ_004776 [Wickerhamomyces pijperi]